MKHGRIVTRGIAGLRSILFTVLITVIIVIPLSVNVLAQNGNTGLGIGQGHGTEVGINLPALNALKADAARGVYNRPCTAAEHDPTKWHTLVNVQAKCHYDHMHGDDPTYVNDIFGEPGAWFNRSGQTISYPWQTFKATTQYEQNGSYVANKQMENDLKHEGYIWLVRRDQSCPTGNCVRDFRLQTHAIFGAHDMPVRFHSFSIEARLCTNGSDLSTCGIVRYGGWIDMGPLFTTSPGVVKCNHDVSEIFIPLPADTLYFPIRNPSARDEVRCHPNVTSLPAYPSQRPLAEWWGFAGGETRFQLRSFDPIGNVNAQDPSKWQFFCAQTDMNCKYDASIFSVFIGYTLNIFSTTSGTDGRPLDPDRNGRTNFVGYFDRWGGYKPNCTATALDCIPYHYDNVRFNFLNNTEARYFHTVCETCTRVDMDISPPGQRWITWFYRYANNHNPTPTPVTPTTPPPATPTPRPPATPTPGSPTTPRTLTVQINSTMNDVNEVNGQLDPIVTPLWIGNNGSTTTSFTGLRFSNVAIPRGAKITSARLEFYSAQSQWISINVQIAAEAANNSAAFSASSRPSQRPLTSTINHSSNVNWSANTWYTLSDVGGLVQQIVNRSGWNSGNSLTLILKGAGTGTWARKFVRSYEGGASSAARLIITYTT